MTIELLSRQELQVLNKQGFKYPLAIAEKDYFLAVVLKILYNSHLKDVLVFKGGTALHHIYLPQLRFSQDLDFTALRKVTIEELQDIFEPYEFLSFRKHYTSRATVKIERLLFNGGLDSPASLRIEIDFTQDVVLPAKEIVYANAYKVAVKTHVMDMREICAEKIRAMNERFRYRDFYDFSMILEHHTIDLHDVLNLLNQKEQRKPFALKNILTHWELACKAKARDIDQIHLSKEIDERNVSHYLACIPIE